jgi:protease IV
MKLIDQIGDFQAALDDTAKSVGIKGEPTLVRPEKQKRSLLDILFGDISDIIPDRAKLMQSHVGFYYLWN